MTLLVSTQVWAMSVPVSRTQAPPVAQIIANGLEKDQPATDSDTVASQLPGDHCIPIETIGFQGLEILSPEIAAQAGAMVHPYLGHCLSMSEISEMAQSINRLLLENGLVTARASLPEQSLADGVLTVSIVEAGLIWETPSQTLVSVKRPRPTWLGKKLEIGGDSRTGQSDYRGRLALAADAFAGLDGNLNLRYNRAVDNERDGRNWGLNFDYSFPWRYDSTISLNGNVSEYENSVVGQESKYGVGGDSQNIEMSARRTLFSFDGLHISGLMGVTSRGSRWYSEASGDASSRQLSAFRVETRFNQQLVHDTRLTTAFSIERGLGLFGADDQEDYADGNPRFRKYRLYSSLQRPLLDWQLNLNGQYQYSPDKLPWAHRVTVASASMIKGFDSQSLSGNEGGWLRLDARSPWHQLDLNVDLKTSFQVSVLKGWVPESEFSGDRHGSASAAEMAFNLKGDRLSAGLRIGRMIEAANEQADRPAVPDLAMNVSLTL